MKVINLRDSIPKLAFLLLAVTALGFPLLFVAAWWVTRSLALDVSLLHLAIGAGLLTAVADIFLAIANERFNKQPDAKFHQRNEPVGYDGVVVDGFTPVGTSSRGYVRVQGQIWKAQCDSGVLLASGQKVKVTEREGLTLVITPVS